ncbi:MAG: SEC-C metal-binding domain-containing protein [Pseudomonadota bacterium]
MNIHVDAPDGIESPGGGIVHLSGKLDMDPSKNGHALLARLWLAYRQRHTDHIARLSRRYQTMKSMGERIAFNQPAESHKVGRNESCPCGSGKKYKKCCATA